MTPTVAWMPETPDAAALLMPAFQGFSKIQGMLLCKVLGLPTLKGVIIDPAQVDLEIFRHDLLRLSADRYLLRHDKVFENGSYPQGGYLIRNSELAGEIDWYRAQSRLMALFEPAHPLDNVHSAGVTVTSDGVATLELVGPGFDASDINRGYITPQETYKFLLGTNRRPHEISHQVTDNLTYDQAKRLRIKKVALKFVARHKYLNDADTLDMGSAVRMIRNNLMQFPSVKKLLSGEQYVPASSDFIFNLCRYAEEISSFAKGRRRGFIAFSASQIWSGTRDVVWDIVFPERKYSAWKELGA